MQAPLRAVLRQHGPMRSPDLQARLGVSQSTLSRALRALGADVVVVGKARRTTYALRRSVSGVVAPVPVYEVPPSPEPPRELCRLHPIEPADGVWVEAVSEGAPEGFYDDLPWFLHDLRPQGYLGQLVPRLHPDLGLAPDVRLWRADEVLRYLTAAGSDGPGALVVGEPAFAEVLERSLRPEPGVAEVDRADAWCRRAEDVLAFGRPGSSAGGERPKFLARVDRGDGPVDVLVKFSPPRSNPLAVRIADLLVCEALALSAIAEAGVPAASARVLEAGERVFLEVDRFDRPPAGGRRGLVSLAAIDAESVGSALRGWSGSTAALLEQGRIDAEDHRKTRWLECFGRWIGNTDMHFGNLGFFASGARILGLAPAYDMVPMAWFPRGHELVHVRFAPPAPGPGDGDVAASAWQAAKTFWRRVSSDGRVSEGFRAQALAAGKAVEGLEPAVKLLPGA